MTTVQLDVPNDLLALPNQTTESLRVLAREALLVRLYDQGVISSGWAAQTLGVSRRVFLDLLGAYRVSEFDAQVDVVDEARHG